MNFDLSKVMQDANSVTSSISEGGNSSSNQRKLIYPQPGVLKVRLLFNNASQSVMRKVDRHTVNGKKTACLQQYGQDCPLCKTISDITNAKGLDLWKLKRTTRGIAFAEYIESDYKWDKPEYEPQRGEIVLLMFPWTIYTDLNRLISGAGQHLYSLVASNVGGIFKISRWTENKQVKYKAEIDPFINNHQTRATDEEYNKLIMELESLNELIIPHELNDDLVSAARAMADGLNQEYLSPQVLQPNVGNAGMGLGQFNSQIPGAVPQQFSGQVPSQQFSNQQQFTNPSQTFPGQVPPAVPQQQFGAQGIVTNQQLSPAVDPAQQFAQQQQFSNQQSNMNSQTPQTDPAQSANATNEPLTYTDPSTNITYVQVNGSWVVKPDAPGVSLVGGANTQDQNTVPTQDDNPAPQETTVDNSDKPACFGQHGSPAINPNQCLMCPAEALCVSSKQ